MAKKLRSKQLTKTGVEVNVNHCRKCQRDRSPLKFYDATDIYLDTNGLFSVCIDCINEIFDTIYANEKSIEVTILKMCRMFNLAYVPEAIETTKHQLETRKETRNKEDSFFGTYKAKVKVTLRAGVHDNDVDMTYKEVTSIIAKKDNIITDDDVDNSQELVAFWGTDDKDDIAFLENQFSNFKQTHKADTYAEVILLKEVCYKILEIDKSRKQNKSIDSSLKSLQEVMKSLAISPNISNASSGKSIDSFGVWIKEIESLTPAEWIEDKSIFRDVDNIEEYTEKFITSPLRSFVTGNKEFDFDEGDETSSITVDDDDDSSVEE